MIFVLSGAAPSVTGQNSGITLKNNQSLVGQGVDLVVTFNGMPETLFAAGTPPVITHTAGTAVTLAQNNTIKGLNIGGATPVAGTGIFGNSYGTLTMSSVGIATNSGSVVNLANGTLAVELISLSLTSSSGRGLSVTNSGPANEGVFLQNNSGTFSFNGLNITNTGNTGFSASSGGTVNVTGTANTINTTNGTALNLANTTIGASGITFRSISASGGTNGIVLNNTGTSGGLTVTGTGTPGSGGTIQNTTGDGISLTNASNISFDTVVLNTTGRHGIFGTGVSNLTFEDGQILNAGNADEEHAFFFATLGTANLTGTLNLTNTLIQNFLEKALFVNNNSGALTMNVNNVDFINNDDAVGNNAIDVVSMGTAGITLNVTNGSLFDNIENNAIQFEGEGSGTNDVNIIGNTFQNGGGPDNFPLGGGIELIVDQGRTLTFDVQGNTFTDVPDDAVLVVGEGNAQGRIGGDVASQGNNIGIGPGSFGLGGDGIRLDPDGSFNTGSFGALNWAILIKNNTIDLNGVGDDGIQILNRDHTGTLNLTIDNNLIRETLSEGIRVFSDEDLGLGANNPKLNLRIANNDFTSIDTDNNESEIELRTADTANACYHVTGNDNGAGGSPGTINFDEAGTSTAQITQASTAALSAANAGATVTVSTGALSFGATCTNPTLPSNP